MFDNRQNLVETAVNAAIAYIPAPGCDLTLPDALTLPFRTSHFSALIHNTVRTNRRPPESVLVARPTHGSHDPIKQKHCKSKGDVFILRALALGSRPRDVNAFPATGTANPTFPVARSRNPAALIALRADRVAYPFRLSALGRAGYAVDMTQPRNEHAAR